MSRAAAFVAMGIVALVGSEGLSGLALFAAIAGPILAVAAEGDVMPQKSTYFYPKALTGLVLNPHEW